jgi:hypothetical protein
VGLCTEFPSLSWLAATPEKALSGIRRVVGEVVAEMAACGEPIPEANLSPSESLKLSLQAYVDGQKTTTHLLNEVKAKYAALRR